MNPEEIWKKNKFEIIFIIIASICFLGALILYFSSISVFNSQKISVKENIKNRGEVILDKSTTGQIIVDIAGSVKKPGAYKITSDFRLKDIVDKAGGLSDTADTAFFNRNYNLAKSLSDGEKIYIPSKQEVADGLFTDTTYVMTSKNTNSVSVAGEATNIKLNINSASQKELEDLPGVGEVTAEKIINGRPYSAIEDLINKKIVNKGVWEKIKGLIVIN